MNTIALPGIHEVPPADIQIGIAVLEALAPMYPNLAFVRQAGLTVSVPEHIEAAYVAKHGEKGQWLIDVILGRKETIASVNVRVFMRLEDPEAVDQILGKNAESPLPAAKAEFCAAS
jgi:hypothetical protein